MKISSYCIFSRDALKMMNGNRGKMASQAGHAFLHSYWDAEASPIETKRALASLYKSSGMAYKITLVVDGTIELLALRESYKNVCGVSLVRDAGLTVFNKPTVTCLGLGPISEDLIRENLSNLKVLI